MKKELTIKEITLAEWRGIDTKRNDAEMELLMSVYHENKELRDKVVNNIIDFDPEISSGYGEITRDGYQYDSDEDAAEDSPYFEEDLEDAVSEYLETTEHYEYLLKKFRDKKDAIFVEQACAYYIELNGLDKAGITLIKYENSIVYWPVIIRYNTTPTMKYLILKEAEKRTKEIKGEK